MKEAKCLIWTHTWLAETDGYACQLSQFTPKRSGSTGHMFDEFIKNVTLSFPT